MSPTGKSRPDGYYDLTMWLVENKVTDLRIGGVLPKCKGQPAVHASFAGGCRKWFERRGRPYAETALLSPALFGIEQILQTLPECHIVRPTKIPEVIDDTLWPWNWL